MRWLLLVFTLFAVVLCFTRHSGGAMGFWLFVWMVGAFATALTFAKTKIADNARADSLSEYDLKRLREGRDPFDHDRSTPKR